MASSWQYPIRMLSGMHACAVYALPLSVLSFRLPLSVHLFLPLMLLLVSSRRAFRARASRASGIQTAAMPWVWTAVLRTTVETLQQSGRQAELPARGLHCAVASSM